MGLINKPTAYAYWLPNETKIDARIKNIFWYLPNPPAFSTASS